MVQLIAGLVIFLGMHSISIIAPGLRDAMAAKLGVLPWRGLYSVVSIVGFVLIVHGYAATRLSPEVLYVPPLWLRHVSFVLMLFVFPLFLASFFPGRIKAAVKHPTVITVKIWAIAHLLANGNVADVLLFGAFLAWAVVDLISVKRRPARATPALPKTRFNDAIVVVGGLALYGVFALWLHPLLIGVALVG